MIDSNIITVQFKSCTELSDNYFVALKQPDSINNIIKICDEKRTKGVVTPLGNNQYICKIFKSN